MPPKAEKGTVKSVDIIDCSDVEGGSVVGMTTTSNTTASHPSPQLQRTLESHSFWKAGAYDVGHTTKRPPDDGSPLTSRFFFFFSSFLNLSLLSYSRLAGCGCFFFALKFYLQVSWSTPGFTQSFFILMPLRIDGLLEVSRFSKAKEKASNSRILNVLFYHAFLFKHLGVLQCLFGYVFTV